MSPFSTYAVALFSLLMRVNSYPSNNTLELSTSLQYEYKDPETGVLKPYVPFDLESWTIDSSFYKGVPMITKTTVFDGKTLTYQDFDLEHLSLDQLRQYVLNGDEYLHQNGSHTLSDSEVEFVREVFVSHDLGIKHRGVGTAPRDLTKRGGLDNWCWEDQKHNWCSPECSYAYTRTVVQTVNRNVYGFYHYEDANAMCGPGTVSFSQGRTQPSSLQFIAKLDLQTWGKGFLRTATQILKDAGFGVAKTPDSVTTTISYAGTCYPYTKCNMWYRPHFQVFKGLTTLSVLGADQSTHCVPDVTSPWEAHTPLPDGVDGGPFIHGICQARDGYGCIATIRHDKRMPYCPK